MDKQRTRQQPSNNRDGAVEVGPVEKHIPLAYKSDRERKRNAHTDRQIGQIILPNINKQNCIATVGSGKEEDNESEVHDAVVASDQLDLT